jgi:hypothetical protein
LKPVAHLRVNNQPNRSKIQTAKMQTIIDILNTLSESMGKDVVKHGAEVWLTITAAKEFMAAHPGMEFRNEGYISNAPLTEKELAALEPPTEASAEAEAEAESESETETEDPTLYNLRLLAEAVALTAIE